MCAWCGAVPNAFLSLLVALVVLLVCERASTVRAVLLASLRVVQAAEWNDHRIRRLFTLCLFHV